MLETLTLPQWLEKHRKPQVHSGHYECDHFAPSRDTRVGNGVHNAVRESVVRAYGPGFTEEISGLATVEIRP